MRILSLTFLFVDDFIRLIADTGTPPEDRDVLERSLRELDVEADPRCILAPVREHPLLLELRIDVPSSGHTYGLLFVDMGHAADAIAYWRDPPLYVDEHARRAHGLSRDHALALAVQRLESNR